MRHSGNSVPGSLQRSAVIRTATSGQNRASRRRISRAQHLGLAVTDHSRARQPDGGRKCTLRLRSPGYKQGDVAVRRHPLGTESCPRNKVADCMWRSHPIMTDYPVFYFSASSGVNIHPDQRRLRELRRSVDWGRVIHGFAAFWPSQDCMTYPARGLALRRSRRRRSHFAGVTRIRSRSASPKTTPLRKRRAAAMRSQKRAPATQKIGILTITQLHRRASLRDRMWT